MRISLVKQPCSKAIRSAEAVPDMCSCWVVGRKQKATGSGGSRSYEASATPAIDFQAITQGHCEGQAVWRHVPRQYDVAWGVRSRRWPQKEEVGVRGSALAGDSSS